MTGPQFCNVGDVLQNENVGDRLHPQLYATERLLEERLFLQCRLASGPSHLMAELQDRLAEVAMRLAADEKDERAMKIIATYAPPPIPDRNFDWSAIDDDTYDGAEDSRTRNQIGYGRTEDEARADLLAQLEDAA